MNSKGEYNRCKIPRLMIEGTDQGEDLERKDFQTRSSSTGRERTSYKRGRWEWGRVLQSPSHLSPPSYHVSVQLWTQDGVPIGDDSAAKILTLWAMVQRVAQRALHMAPHRTFAYIVRFLDVGTIKSSTCTMQKKLFK